MWFWLFLLMLFINIFLGFYIRWILKVMISTNERVSDTKFLIQRYKDHINSLHELEMFYGDNTLKGLMEHSSELISNLKELDFFSDEDEEEMQTLEQEVE